MNSRSKNAKLNIIVGYFAHFSTIILSFIGRKVFLLFLNTEYLGVNGLYSNILSVLSLAELGIDAAAVYTLYKPIADNKIDEILSYVNYFRRLYRRIAVSMFGIGLLLIPLLGFIVHSGIPKKETIVYYVIFLLNSMITYFAADKVVFLSAKQEQRATRLIMVFIQLFQIVFQIICLVLSHSFFVYTVVMVLCSIMYNIIINYICKKKYPYLSNKTICDIVDHSSISERIRSTMLYKVGAILVNNTDNILISCLVSTAAVGLYSNYVMIINAIQGFIGIITTSLVSGIGNVFAKNDVKRAKELFFTILLFYQMIATVGSVGIYLCANDFINIWLGEQFAFSRRILFAIVFNFFTSNIISPIWMYREASGMFKQVKYLMLINAIANLLLSFALGIMWGVFGILIATTLARVITLVWYEPKLLFRTVFHESSRIYWGRQLCALLIAGFVFIICLLLLGIFERIFLNLPLIKLVIKALSVIAAVGISYILIYHKSRGYKEIIGFLKGKKV